MKQIKIVVPASWDFMSAQDRAQTLKNMRTGGSFATKMADVIDVADSTNTETIVAAFSHLIERFQPESAIQEIEADWFPFGTLEKEGNHSDEFFLVQCSAKVTADRLKTHVTKTYKNETDIGQNKGLSVHVREGIDHNQFIVIVRRRLD